MLYIQIIIFKYDKLHLNNTQIKIGIVFGLHYLCGKYR